MPSEHQDHRGMGTTTRAIADLLPDVSRGDKEALNALVAIAHNRLLQLIRGKKAKFAGGLAHRYYRDNEQTGIILSDLYLRLLKAVENRKLSDLKHPAGFWKIAADNVMFILLEMARDRKRQRERRHGGDDDSQAGAGQINGGSPRGDGPGFTAARASGDSQSHSAAGGRALDPLEQIPDQREETPESYLLRQEVLDAVQRLPEPHQTILAMYYYLGLTQREISQIHLPAVPQLHERKVGRIIDQAEEMLRPVLGPET